MHTPVLLKEVLDYAKQVKRLGGTMYVDVTCGYGGHSYSIYKYLKGDEGSQGSSIVLSLEWDPVAIEYLLSEYRGAITDYLEFDHLQHRFVKHSKFVDQYTIRWILVRSNFAYLDEVLKGLTAFGVPNSIDFLLADLGVSSPQLADKERGFSFAASGVLDMRMAPDQYHVRAADLLNFLSEGELVRLFVDNVGMPRSMAKALAWHIVKERSQRRFGGKDDIDRIKRIVSIVKPVRRGAKKRLNPATLVFLALRIAVNMELEHLRRLIHISGQLLSKMGIALFIGFHSAEWAILASVPSEAGLKLLEVKVPSSDEVRANIRSRSAKMYVFRHAG